jgi:hypothetical protein
MRTRAFAVGALVAGLGLAGCEPADNYSFNGYRMQTFFPFDGSRSWEYVNVDDDTVPYKLIATLIGSEDLDGVRIYEVEFQRECVGAAECEPGHDHSIWMSSDGDGVRVHRWGDAGATPVDFDPPLALADGSMVVDDSVSTTTIGSTWTTTFAAMEACPVQWTDEWDECAKFTVDAGGTDHPLVGTWWAVTGYNIVAWRTPDSGDQWQLLYATFE